MKPDNVFALTEVILLLVMIFGVYLNSRTTVKITLFLTFFSYFLFVTI